MDKTQTASSVLILLQQGERYLWQRRAWEDDSYPGRLDFAAGGGVEAGEGLEQAALRELQEELGVSGMALQAGRHCELDGEPCALFHAGWPENVLLGAEVAELVALSLAELRCIPQWLLHPQLGAWLAMQEESAHN